MNAERRTHAARGIGHLAWAVIAMLGLGGCRDAAAPPPVSAPVPQASAVLYGRVVGSDHAPASPADWQVRVTAEYEDGSAAQPHDRESGGDLFAFKVVPGKRVRLYFEAVPYQATVTEFLDVSRDDSVPLRVPDIVMDRIRWTMALFAQGNGEAFGRNLEAQAAMAEATGSSDIFVANLEFYRKASAKFPDCMRKIEAFEATPRHATLVREAEHRGVPVGLLKGLVTAPGNTALREPESLRALAAAPAVAGSLRTVARQALAGTDQASAPAAPPVTPAVRTPPR
ncbi:hypothetical protein [Luteitalea sp.]|jgi:hypothetical protein|uniref:hypothetical protein n=1 Tax=Luteitalea sp. TaxID=2004800 RepID=UPI0037C4FE82